MDCRGITTQGMTLCGAQTDTAQEGLLGAAPYTDLRVVTISNGLSHT